MPESGSGTRRYEGLRSSVGGGIEKHECLAPEADATNPLAPDGRCSKGFAVPVPNHGSRRSEGDCLTLSTGVY